MPRFGDRILNTAASESNPTRVGTFVRAVYNTGRMNKGTWWECTDEKGKFWLNNPERCEIYPSLEATGEAGPDGALAQEVISRCARLARDIFHAGAGNWYEIAQAVLREARSAVPAEPDRVLAQKFQQAKAAVLYGVSGTCSLDAGGVSKDEALEYAAEFIRAYEAARSAVPTGTEEKRDVRRDLGLDLPRRINREEEDDV